MRVGNVSSQGSFLSYSILLGFHGVCFWPWTNLKQGGSLFKTDTPWGDVHVLASKGQFLLVCLSQRGTKRKPDARFGNLGTRRGESEAVPPRDRRGERTPCTPRLDTSPGSPGATFPYQVGGWRQLSRGWRRRWQRMRTWFCKGGHKSSLALALYGEAAGPRPDHVRFRSIDDVDAKGEMSKVGRKRDPCHRFSSVSRPVHRQDSIPSFPWFASTFSLRRHPHKFQPPNLQEEHDRGSCALHPEPRLQEAPRC